MKRVSSTVRDFLTSRVSYPLAREYDVKVPGAVNLASNESPYGPSPGVIRALGKELEFVGMYPDPKAKSLKRAIGRYVGVGDEEVAIGNGSDELMDLICKAFLDPGDRVLIPTPTFSMYELAARVNGGRPVFCQLQSFGWAAEKMARAARGAKLVFVGRPNNPTGNSPGEETLKEIARGAGLVVVDEAYVEFARGSAVRLAARRDNIIVLRTFSKAFGLAGLRVGYAVGNPELVRVLEQIRAPFNVNRLAQTAALAALGDMEYVKQVVRKIKAERERLRRALSALGLRVFPSEANFLMVDVSAWKFSSREFCDRLAKRKIFVRDLSGFRGAGEDYVRITVGIPQQNRKLIAELEKLKGGEKSAG